ncbi:hypothetical protein M501DRAFT_1005576 [Patellaria atrata CBS 101060]|uniref:Uncharacterized protein n=1 Tax=Patellaria atrata CBS 101060 TaxID=1346257 RepID=A0A9P4VUU7_9PEZI|nr:hypothetical protein M501DRAFT_1005576 [Patellaria atrata CBS 101060]
MANSDHIVDPFLIGVLDAASLARDQCISLLQTLDNIHNPSATAEAATQQKQLFSHLSHVRGLTRSANLRVRNTKQATAEARQEIDTLHLQLQNLYYEQRHLRGEIAACEAYEHKYQQLPLIPVDDFLAQFPEHSDDDNNTLMVARINHEHAQRQALEEKRQGLLKKKQGLIAENNKRKDDLANLDKDLEKFIEAAAPIQKIFEKEY